MLRSLDVIAPSGIDGIPCPLHLFGQTIDQSYAIQQKRAKINFHLRRPGGRSGSGSRIAVSCHQIWRQARMSLCVLLLWPTTSIPFCGTGARVAKVSCWPITSILGLIGAAAIEG